MAWLLKCAFCGHRGTASSSLLDQFLKLLIFHPETRSPSFALSLLFCWDSEAPPASHAFRLKVHRHTGPGWVFPGPGARPAALPSRVCFAWHLWSTSRPVLVLGPGEQRGRGWRRGLPPGLPRIQARTVKIRDAVGEQREESPDQKRGVWNRFLT